MQKNQLIALQEHFQRYCNMLPVFGFNSAKHDINLIKSFLFSIVVNERDIEPTVIKKLIRLFLSNLETFSYLTLSIFSVVQPVSTVSSKLTTPKRQRVYYPTNIPIVQRKLTTRSFLPLTPSLAYSAIATPLKNITKSLKIL